MNNEYDRLVATLQDGTLQYQFAGSIRLNFATDAGASVTVSASSPGTQFVHPDGTIEFMTFGRVVDVAGPGEADALGLPSNIVVLTGRNDITYHFDGTVSGTIGTVAEDVCAELGAVW